MSRPEGNQARITHDHLFPGEAKDKAVALPATIVPVIVSPPVFCGQRSKSVHCILC